MPQRLVGINHVALEVGDIEEALAFYGAFFEIHLRGVVPGMAFIDMGDQFLALSEGRSQAPDDHRHFGLVVDDKAAVRAELEAAGIEILPGPRARLPRPVGQPDRDRRLPRHPVHEGRRRCSPGWVSNLEKQPEALEQLQEKGLL